MQNLMVQERAYFQRRLREEIARCRRYKDIFHLVLVQAMPAPGSAPQRRQTEAAAELLRERMRTSDVVSPVFDDMIAVMLVGTPKSGLYDARHRMRHYLSRTGGSWHFTIYAFPEDVAQMESLDLLSAA